MVINLCFIKSTHLISKIYSFITEISCVSLKKCIMSVTQWSILWGVSPFILHLFSCFLSFFIHSFNSIRVIVICKRVNREYYVLSVALNFDYHKRSCSIFGSSTFSMRALPMLIWLLMIFHSTAAVENFLCMWATMKEICKGMELENLIFYGRMGMTTSNKKHVTFSRTFFVVVVEQQLE